jgi:hypothetical protein
MTYGKLLLAGLLIGAFASMGGCRHRQHTQSVESIVFAARAELLSPGDSILRVRVVATNTGRAATWTLQLGHCSMNVRVATMPPATTRERDYSRWRNALSPPAACPSYLTSWRLPPGKSASSSELERTVRARDVLGDSLPPGRYRVTALVGFNNQSSGDLAAGEVELRAPY